MRMLVTPKTPHLTSIYYPCWRCVDLKTVFYNVCLAVAEYACDNYSRKYSVSSRWGLLLCRLPFRNVWIAGYAWSHGDKERDIQRDTKIRKLRHSWAAVHVWYCVRDSSFVPTVLHHLAISAISRAARYIIFQRLRRLPQSGLLASSFRQLCEVCMKTLTHFQRHRRLCLWRVLRTRLGIRHTLCRHEKPSSISGRYLARAIWRYLAAWLRISDFAAKSIPETGVIKKRRD